MCMYPFKQYNFSTTIRVASTSLYKSVKVKRKYIIKNTNCMHKSWLKSSTQGDIML